MAEIWDAYDDKFNKIEGVTLVRGVKIPDGFFHLICDVIVQHADGSYLITQRDPKKTFGLMWESTSGGSALKGEEPKQCILRELFEETGIRPNHIEEIGRLVMPKFRSICVEFKALVDCPKDSIILQKGENVAYKWISGEELSKMKASELSSIRILQFIKGLKAK